MILKINLSVTYVHLIVRYSKESYFTLE